MILRHGIIPCLTPPNIVYLLFETRSSRLNSLEKIKKFFTTPKVVGLGVIAIAIIDWKGRLEELMKVPGWIADITGWFAGHPIVIKFLMVAVGLVLVIWDERRRNDARYLTKENAQALIKEVTANTIEPIRVSLRKDLNQSVDILLEKIKGIKDVSDADTSVVKSLAELAYLDERLAEFEKKMDEYKRLWMSLEGFVTTQPKDWYSAPVQQSFLTTLDSVNKLFKIAKEEGSQFFGVDLDGQTRITNRAAIPNLAHVSVDAIREQFAKAWYDYQRRSERIDMILRSIGDRCVVNKVIVSECARSGNALGPTNFS